MKLAPWARYAGIFSLCVFYAWVWHLVGNPRVDAVYRSYFIERTLRYWPTDPRGAYRSGTRIDFSKASPYLSRRGWAQPDGDRTWMIERSADLFLVLDSVPSGPMELQLEASAFVPDRYRRATVETSINGAVIGREMFRENDRPQYLRLQVPAQVVSDSPALGNRRVLRIRFELLPPGPPVQTRVYRDRKVLGLHVSWLCLGSAGRACTTAEE